jgi:hypothetical protein
MFQHPEFTHALAAQRARELQRGVTENPLVREAQHTRAAHRRRAASSQSTHLPRATTFLRIWRRTSTITQLGRFRDASCDTLSGAAIGCVERFGKFGQAVVKAQQEVDPIAAQLWISVHVSRVPLTANQLEPLVRVTSAPTAAVCNPLRRRRAAVRIRLGSLLRRTAR